MLEVQKIVGSVLTSNMYIIKEVGSSNCWVVDIGDAATLFDNLPQNANVQGLFLTHGHFDHIAGINMFHQKFPKTAIYTSEYGKEQLYSAKKNFSLYHEQPTVYKGTADSIVIVRENEEVSLCDNEVMKVIPTPGHCPSCLSYLLGECLFTGDSYIPGAPIVTRLPQGDKVIAEESLRLIKRLGVDKKIYPGHDVDKWVSMF